jgi:signal transduction histidine kinase
MQVTEFITERRETIILVLMLESLHIALWGEFANWMWRAMFMIFHLGLFLLWQPLWRGDQRISPRNAMLFIALAVLFVMSRSWWLRAGWVIVLIGVCGGNIGANVRERRANMIILAFLTFQLAIPCVIPLFNVSIPEAVRQPFGVVVGVLPLALLAFPVPVSRAAGRGVDPVYAITAATLVTLLVAGSLLIMYRSGLDYLTALIWALTAIGGALLVISWLLTPQMRFSGLAQLWQRAIINIGTPFERWLSNLAHLFTRAQSPEEFLRQAMAELVALDWVAGVQWDGPDVPGSAGAQTAHNAFFAFEPLRVRVYTRQWLGGALYPHCRLLVQVINHFYSAKHQERELARQTHLSAIYETGARVTHDIKNLLQALQALTSVIASDDSESGMVSRLLLRRQLPHLTQRLQLALDKLQEPGSEHRETVFLKDWWHDFRLRNPDPWLSFHTDINGDPRIPADLFDSVAENLLENVRAKRQVEPDIHVEARVVSDGERTWFEVCDSGSGIPPDRVQELLRGPVSSESGLGIGLYQAALQAERAGYALTLESAETGRVGFRLTGNARQEEGDRRVD